MQREFMRFPCVRDVQPALSRHRAGPSPRVRGFTLVELLVAIAVLAILVNIALPSLHEFVLASNVSSTTDRLVAQLNLARSEALRRGGHVALACKASGCGNDWSAGWRVQDDAARTIVADAGVDTGQGYKVGVAADTRAGASRIAFTSIGALASNAETNLFICRPDANAKKSWRIRVLPAGSIKASRDTSGVAGNPCGA